MPDTSYQALIEAAENASRSGAWAGMRRRKLSSCSISSLRGLMARLESVKENHDFRKSMELGRLDENNEGDKGKTGGKSKNDKYVSKGGKFDKKEKPPAPAKNQS